MGHLQWLPSRKTIRKILHKLRRWFWSCHSFSQSCLELCWACYASSGMESDDVHRRRVNSNVNRLQRLISPPVKAIELMRKRQLLLECLAVSQASLPSKIWCLAHHRLSDSTSSSRTHWVLRKAPISSASSRPIKRTRLIKTTWSPNSQAQTILPILMTSN